MKLEFLLDNTHSTIERHLYCNMLKWSGNWRTCNRAKFWLITAPLQTETNTHVKLIDNALYQPLPSIGNPPWGCTVGELRSRESCAHVTFNSHSSADVKLDLITFRVSSHWVELKSDNFQSQLLLGALFSSCMYKLRSWRLLKWHSARSACAHQKDSDSLICKVAMSCKINFILLFALSLSLARL